jgi:hypothetical protein
MHIIMNELYNVLPKDLVNIVEEYAKDRTNYDKVIDELESSIIESTRWVYWHTVGFDLNFCHREVDEEEEDCDCEYQNTFQHLIYVRPQCYISFMETLNEIMNYDRLFQSLLRKMLFSIKLYSEMSR